MDPVIRPCVLDGPRNSGRAQLSCSIGNDSADVHIEVRQWGGSSLSGSVGRCADGKRRLASGSDPGQSSSVAEYSSGQNFSELRSSPSPSQSRSQSASPRCRCRCLECPCSVRPAPLAGTAKPVTALAAARRRRRIHRRLSPPPYVHSLRRCTGVMISGPLMGPLTQIRLACGA